MAEILKLKGNERALNGTSNNISLATVVKIVNSNTTTAAVITLLDASNVQIANTTLLPSDQILLMKEPTHNLRSSLTTLVLATPIAFT